jgi:S1-C subfamily serine protease
MNIIDAGVLVLLLIGMISGARAGFLGPVLGLVGAAVGLGLAILLAGVFRDQLATIEQPLRAVATLVALGAFVLVGEALGAAAGTMASLSLWKSGLRPLDAAGGAVVGAAHVGLLVWLIGGMLAIGMAPSLSAAARDSFALRTFAERLPQPTVVAGRLLAQLDPTGLPQLFAGFEPAPAPPVELPADAETRALAQSAIASTALIATTGCGSTQAVGSGFFVSATQVVTNAHVVAGGTATTVTVGGSVHTATVVAFDPAADLALLNVASARAPALQLSPTAPARGTTGVALGYPGGGDLTATPAAVTAAFRAGGPDIYGEGISERSVVEMNAQIRPGNSGGPLVIAPGVVGGVVFGASRAAPDVGYAIGADQALEILGPAFGSTTAVGTGSCL